MKSMASSKTLQQAIADITIWRKGEQRAPHKPLLLLHVLAGYQQGHGRLFDYGSEVRDPLHSLLERFGPQRAQYRPDMPFWRLQGDGFWELSIQEEIADELGFDILQIRKQRDPLFRQQVLRAYNYECAICGFNMRHDSTSVALEAAHIKWKQHGGPCEISNGLALCAIHHKAFDKGSIGLDESMRVQVSPAVNGSGMVGRLFWDFDGKSIALPMMRENYPKEGFVEWHRKEVFRR